jgi:hypothetical protein
MFKLDTGQQARPLTEYQLVRNWAVSENKRTASWCGSLGSDPGGTRTLNQLIKSQLLCQLSYGAIVRS